MQPLPKMLDKLSEDVRSFYSCSNIKRMYRPTALEFLRDCVSAHQPVILEGILDDWPAMRTWASTEGFLAACPAHVNVNFTPDGRADSVQSVSSRDLGAAAAAAAATDTTDGDCNGASVFAEPLEVSISTPLFMQMLECPEEGDAIPYLSAQNDNLRQQMPNLLPDCSESLPLADECFGVPPEAVNLWVGDERSVSSTHKDYFENMYCVVRGTKTFTLFPPTDVAYLPTGTYPRFTYAHAGTAGEDAPAPARPQKAQMTLVPVKVSALDADRDDVINDGDLEEEEEAATLSNGAEDNKDCSHSANDVQWIWLDPEDPAAAIKHPDFALASPLRIEVHAGEVLYLPAMWLHRVSQTCISIAVNFWYDMRFDLRYVLLQVCQRLADAHRATTTTKQALERVREKERE